MSRLPNNVEESYISTLEASRVIGVNRARVGELISNERICEVTKTDKGWRTTPVRKVFGGWRIPKDFRILRGVRERPGPVKDYIEAWEAAHPEVIEFERREHAREKAERLQREERKRVERATPKQARGSFLGPKV